MKEIECPKTLILIYLCGLNKTLIHWELSLQKVELMIKRDSDLSPVLLVIKVIEMILGGAAGGAVSQLL